MTYRQIGGYKPWGGYTPAKHPKRSRSVVKPKPKPDPEACSLHFKGDEFACHCGLTWAMADIRPACPNRKG